MGSINLFELFLWTFRRSERDVVNLYNSLSGVMRLATGGSMLNFGYWDESTPTPLSAQRKLCSIFGDLADLRPGQKVVDVGSGYGDPALQWDDEHGPLGLACLDINYGHLQSSKPGVFRINAAATALPFGACCVDRVLAFESAQHFRPLSSFLSEAHRVLNDSGMLAVAMPVMSTGTRVALTKLGLLLSMTWSSEHYSEDHVVNSIRDGGFAVNSLEKIGGNVYGPLADYYEKNRDSIKNAISGSYPRYVETILHKSVEKMRSVSEDKAIDYLLISCTKK